MSRILVLMLTLTITCQAQSAEPPKDFTNSIGMKFKLIPAGEFMMGSPEGEEEHEEDLFWKDLYEGDEAQHRVRITKLYYLGVHEVTTGQWGKLMGTHPWVGKPGAALGWEYPVTYVSWYDALEFCEKLSEKEGRKYRLPTEAEWEYACRAGSKKRYCFGDDNSDLGSYAWHDANTFDANEMYAHHVGLKRANAWGLHDMHGNVSEWCQDSYESGYYEISPTDDPAGRHLACTA